MVQLELKKLVPLTLILWLQGFTSGANLTITSILTAPYLQLDRSGQYEGFMADVTKQIAHILGEDYHIKPVADGRYGAQDSDGNWNGMIGELIRGEADIAIAPLTITAQRAKVIDFSQPILIFEGRAMLMQRSTARRILSFHQLAEADDVYPLMVEGGSTMNFFKDSKVHTFLRIWQKCNSHSSCFVKSNEEGVRRARESKDTVFILESTSADYIEQRKPCDLVRVGQTGYSAGYAIATPKNSPYRERIDLAVLEMREKGELLKLRKKWWYDLGECGKRWEETLIASSAGKAKWHHGLLVITIITMMRTFMEFITFI